MELTLTPRVVLVLIEMFCYYINSSWDFSEASGKCTKSVFTFGGQTVLHDFGVSTILCLTKLIERVNRRAWLYARC